MARLKIKWKIEYRDPDRRADIETGEIATFAGEADYVESIKNALQRVLNPYKNKQVEQ